MANIETLLIPGGVVFTLRIKSAEICVICGYNSSGFGMASSLSACPACPSCPHLPHVLTCPT